MSAVHARGHRDSLAGVVRPRGAYAILTAWAVAWGLAFFWLLLQSWLMSDLWWFVPAAVVVPVLVYLGLRAIVRAHLAGRRIASALLWPAALLHLLPLVRQLGGAIDPSWDTTILGVVAATLVWALRPVPARRDGPHPAQ